MTQPIYRDDPPTEPGWYWVCERETDYARLMKMYDYGWWLGNIGAISSFDLSRSHQFGPRVPSPEVCARIQEDEK